MRVLSRDEASARFGPVGIGRGSGTGAGRPPVGESHGVRAERSHGSLVLVFKPQAAKLRKRINSPYAWIECTQVPDGLFSGVHSGNLDVPARTQGGHRLRRERRGLLPDLPQGARGSRRAMTERSSRSRPRRVPSTSTSEGRPSRCCERRSPRVREGDAELPGSVTYARLSAPSRSFSGCSSSWRPRATARRPEVGYFSDGGSTRCWRSCPAGDCSSSSRRAA